tara:strand:- start:2309 stop:3658 length:1350 start_codon:yes stop_codon:yes gene_type:complete
MIRSFVRDANKTIVLFLFGGNGGGGGSAVPAWVTYILGAGGTIENQAEQQRVIDLQAGATFVMAAGSYYTGRLPVQIPADGTADFLSVDRATENSRITTGNELTVLADHVPPVTHYGGHPAINIETFSINLASTSEGMVGTNSGLTLAAYAGWGSIGFDNAIRYDGVASTSSYAITGAQITAGNTHTCSTFIRLDDLSTPVVGSGTLAANVDIYLELGASAEVPDSIKLEPYADNVWRVEATWLSPSNTGLMTIKTGTTGVNGSGKPWRITAQQCEDLDYASAYNKTVGASSSRLQTTITNGGSAASLPSTAGTMFLKCSNYSLTGAAKTIVINDGTSSNEISFAYRGSSFPTQIRLQYTIGGTLVARYSFITTITNRDVFAFSWEVGQLKWYLNGALVNTFTNASVVVPPSNTFDNVTMPGFYVAAESLAFHPTVLTDAQITTISNAL